MVMIDVIFLEVALAFVIVATVAAVATTSAYQTVRELPTRRSMAALPPHWFRWR
jgi:hypothetical protein